MPLDPGSVCTVSAKGQLREIRKQWYRTASYGLGQFLSLFEQMQILHCVTLSSKKNLPRIGTCSLIFLLKMSCCLRGLRRHQNYLQPATPALADAPVPPGLHQMCNYSERISTVRLG